MALNAKSAGQWSAANGQRLAVSCWPLTIRRLRLGLTADHLTTDTGGSTCRVPHFSSGRSIACVVLLGSAGTHRPSIPRLLKIQQAKLARQEDAQRENQDAIKKLKLSISQKELTLKTTTAQIEKYKKGLETASHAKEMQAFKSQIATSQEKCKTLEDETLAEMTEVEERTAKLPELEGLVRQARAEYALFEKAQAEKNADRVAQLRHSARRAQGGRKRRSRDGALAV